MGQNNQQSGGQQGTEPGGPKGNQTNPQDQQRQQETRPGMPDKNIDDKDKTANQGGDQNK